MTVIGERYELRRNLGSGGQATVYEAYDRHQNRLVALKIFSKGTVPSRAFRDAQALTSLAGPYILRVFNAEVYQDIAYMATEVATAGTLFDIMSGGLPWDEATRLVRDALLGLDVCHAAGVVHRDVKPGNIFLAEKGPARLGDFGVAEPLDAAGRVAIGGDPLFCAPEMHATGFGDCRSDVYSAAATLYSLLAGRYPFVPPVRSADIVAGAFPPLRDVAPHVPQRVALRVARGMALDPSARYQGARDMANALAELPSDLPVSRERAVCAGHERCWIVRAGQREYAVCLTRDGDRRDVEVRREAGSRSRVRNLCISGLRPSATGVALRRVFDAIERGATGGQKREYPVQRGARAGNPLRL